MGIVQVGNEVSDGPSGVGQKEIVNALHKRVIHIENGKIISDDVHSTYSEKIPVKKGRKARVEHKKANTAPPALNEIASEEVEVVEVDEDS